MVNLASEYVEASRETSPMHQYVADQGKGVTKQDIEHTVVAGRCVSLGDDVTAEDRTLIEEAIRATRPSDKACFANALNMWEYDTRFAYVEGFAVMDDLDHGGFEHAWCLLDDETLVDPTAAFDYYHGAVITDPDILNRYASSDLRASGIIGNHRNRYEFLRARGYGDHP